MSTPGGYATRDPYAVDTVAVVTPSDFDSNAPQSAVSWGAILAGAAASAALSLILIILGVGLGLSSVSPWAFEGVSAETFGWASIIWLALTTIAASGLGGYIAGRLRTKWTAIHGDETYFRDTTHGFLSWAVATLLAAGLLTSAIGGILGTGAKVVGATAGAAASTAGGLAAAGTGPAAMAAQDGDMQYWTDALFRANPGPAPVPAATPAAPPTTAAMLPPQANGMPAPGAERGPDRREVRAEVNRIVVNSLRSERMDGADTQYLAQLVAAQTGISQAEAQTRVNDVQARMRAAIEKAKQDAKQAADDARKATAYAALWLFITLLLGAFCASLFATWGGRRRDL
ncbi:MAG TPA: hypothetical protein VIP30_04970 [Stenotrophomonas sp.]